MYNFFINDYNFFNKNFSKWTTTLNDKEIKIITPEPEKKVNQNIILVPFQRTKYRVHHLISSTWIYFRQIKKNQINIFITIVPIFMGIFATFLKKAPGVFYFTGLGTIFTSTKILSKTIQFLFIMAFRLFMDRKQNLIIVQNSTDMRILYNKIKIKKASIKKINGCGINIKTFDYDPKIKFSNRIRILVPARLIKEKGIMECVIASKILTEKNCPHEFIFTSTIDPGNPSSLTKQEVMELSTYPNLTFTGFVDDILSLYREVDIICLPSYREGLPNALLEGQSIGRLTIASNVPGCRDIIENTKTGFLFQEKSGLAIAETVMKISQDNYNIKSILDKARYRMENKFADDIIISELTSTISVHLKKNI